MTQNVLAVLILTAGASMAADNLTPLNLKPGLWETTTVTERSGMPSIPPDKLASLPPEAKARIQAMSAPMTNTTQSCRTDKDLHPFADDGNKSCKRTVITSTGTRQELKMECDMAGNNKGTGNVTIEVKDPEHVNGTVAMHFASNGRNMDVNVKMTAKWVNSSCGDVKPASDK